jgi:hypothetical protein
MKQRERESSLEVTFQIIITDIRVVYVKGGNNWKQYIPKPFEYRMLFLAMLCSPVRSRLSTFTAVTIIIVTNVHTSL